MFEDYRIPKTALLSKVGDVTAEGKYVSPHKNKEKRSGKPN